MGTPCCVAVKTGDIVQYCTIHYDGYLSHTGKILHEHYNTPELALKLLQGGNMSTIGASCEGAEGHTFEKPVPGQTVYYIRDRGEKEYHNASQIGSLSDYYHFSSRDITWLYCTETQMWYNVQVRTARTFMERHKLVPVSVMLKENGM